VTDPGYYDQSIPPALLLGARRRVAGGAPAEGQGQQSLLLGAGTPGGDQQPSPLLVLAGTPGQYQPAGKAATRPRNVTELNTAGAMPDPPSPWTAGQYVPVGTSGKRAHWNGEEWRGGESPGYPASPVQNEQPGGRHAADDSQADATRVGSEVRQEPPPASESSPGTQLPPAPYQRPQFPGDEQPGDLTR
jgi:hypothetical protein